MNVLIKNSSMASLLHSLRPRSEKMIDGKRGGDGEFSSGGKARLERACPELPHGCPGSHG